MEWAQRLCKLPNQGWILPRVHEELFDLENDPNEQRNLVGEDAHKEPLDLMRKRLDDHMRETDDPFLGKEFEKNYSAICDGVKCAGARLVFSKESF
jgi:hypothetical protein